MFVCDFALLMLLLEILRSDFAGFFSGTPRFRKITFIGQFTFSKRLNNFFERFLSCSNELICIPKTDTPFLPIFVMRKRYSGINAY